MSVKTKLGMGIAGAVLSVGLIGGGTFAYFSDAETTDNSFAAGTLDLSVDPEGENAEAIIDVGNLKPGDWMNRQFELNNDGSLDISKVLVHTDYDYAADGDEDMGEHIRVNFLKNEDKNEDWQGKFLQPDEEMVIESKTLKELKEMDPDAVENQIKYGFLTGPDEEDGLKPGTSDEMTVQFKFVDNDEDQNVFQGKSLDLKWTFEAEQGEGEEK